MRTFFDLSLQEFLERRFQVRAEIMERAPETPEPAIVWTSWNPGVSYYNCTSSHAVALLHGPFTLNLAFSVHEESAQIDSWEVRAEGVPEDAVEELTALCNPRQYNRWLLGNYLEPGVKIETGSKEG